MWRGLVTNDSLHALRAYIQRPDTRGTRRAASNRRGVPLAANHSAQRAGPLVAAAGPIQPKSKMSGHDFSRADNSAKITGASAPADVPTATERSHALAMQLLNRYGVLMREHAAAESIPGGFSAVYDVLKVLEESGRIRRGYFVAGLGATQFALPAAVDMLRQLRSAPEAEKPEFVQMAAADPANPYGSVLRWPDLPVMNEDSESAPRVLTRASYAEVILRNGQLVAWLRRNNPNLLVFLSADEPERSQVARASRTSSARAGRNACTPIAAKACSSPPSTASPWPRTPWRGSSWMQAFILARWACTCAAFRWPGARPARFLFREHPVSPEIHLEPPCSTPFTGGSDPCWIRLCLLLR